MEIEKESTSVKLDDFLLLTVLGKGSYAKVVMVKKKDSGEIFAMKILKKKYIEKRKQEQHVMVERNVLVGIQHQYIVKLNYSFQTPKKLFFCLEYCPGGELFNLLQKKKQFNEDQARFYAAQIVIALEYLHQRDIIYRDLKPENVLIDAKGYIKITDFGLSKMGVKTGHDAKSVCGTPEYLAPEILLKLGHGKAVDWWTLGALIFEMLTGLPPYYTQDREKLFEAIKFKQLRFPSFMSQSVKNLLEGLFQKTPEKRLGGGPEDALAVKKHPWFAVMNWQALMNYEIKAPFIPAIKSETDVQNFDQEFIDMPIESFSQSGQSMGVHGNYDQFTYNEENMKK